jgi:ABC-type amino acid transport substrate-binding protein
MKARTTLCAGALAAMLVGACGGGAAPAVAPSSIATLPASAPTTDPIAAARAELAPTGIVRVAVFGPAFVGSKDATGKVVGVGPELAQALGARLGAEIVVDVYASPVDALKAKGAWDILFIPSNASPEVEAALAYTAPLVLIPHSFLVSDPAIRTVPDLDRASIRVGTEAGHAGQVHAKIPLATVVTLDNDESLAQLKAGTIDAFATGTFALLDALKDLPAGYRVLDGAFFTATLAIGIAKDRPSGLAWLKSFVESQRSSGALQRIIDATGKRGLEVPSAAY